MTPDLLLLLELLTALVLVFLGTWMIGSPAWFERVSRPFALRQRNERGERVRQSGARIAGILLLSAGLAWSVWVTVRLVA